MDDADGVLLQPPVRSITLETWLADLLEEWRSKRMTGGLLLHHFRGSIEEAEPHYKIRRPVKK